MAQLSYRDPGTQAFVPFGGGDVPIGSIMGYGGSVAPAGWHICDGSAHGSAALLALFGSANTPDLRDKFIVGSSGSKPRGTVGGAASVALTAAQSASPSHTHPTVLTGTVSAWHQHITYFPSAGNHNHNTAVSTTGYATNAMRNTAITEDHVDYPLTSAADASGAFGGNLVDAVTGNHGHSGYTGGINQAHSHAATVSAAPAANASAAHENRPPYYAMIFIVKKA